MEFFEENNVYPLSNETEEENMNKDKTNILILGHGLIDSNKFIIIPEHIDLTFYTNKGKSLNSNISKPISLRILKEGDKSHYMKEKTLLNDMNIRLKNMHQFNKNLKIYSDVTSIENTHLINYSGIITTENITPINILSDETYNSYNIINININSEHYKSIRNFDIHNENYHLDNKIYNNTAIFINSICMKEFIKIYDKLPDLDKLYNMNIFKLAIERLGIKKINKNNFDAVNKIITTYIEIYNSNEIKNTINENTYNQLKHEINLIQYNHNIVIIKYFLMIQINNFINNEYMVFSANNRSSGVNYNLYSFNKDYSIHGYSVSNQSDKIYILNNILLNSSHFEKNDDNLKEAFVVLIYIHILNKKGSNNQSIDQSIDQFINETILPNNQSIDQSIYQFINETILPNNYKEHFLSTAWPNIINLSYHYHNNEIISKEEIINNNFDMNLGYILHKIDIYNKNVLGNKKILCHGLNCRNYTPIKSNRNINELQRLINQPLLPNNNGALRRSNSVTVHRLIRQRSESNEYKDLFENIIEKCIEIISNNINYINQTNEHNNANLNKIKNIHRKLMIIYSTYTEKHFLTVNEVKFLIHILRRN